MRIALFYFLLFFVLLFALGSIIYFSVKNGISPMPTALKVKRRFLQTLPQIGAGTIVELGAGWGTLAFSLAKKYPQCTVIAYENSWFPYLICILKQFYKRQTNLKFICQDFYTVSLNRSNLIICYLYPGAMQKLKAKFQNELLPHTIIATHTFAIHGWTPTLEVLVNDMYHTRIYHYYI